MSGSDNYTSSAPPLGFDQAWVNDQLRNGSGVDLLTAQILSQGTYDRWTGQGFGSVLANARAIASRLADAGIKRLEDFGAKTVITADVPAGTAVQYYNKTNGQKVGGDQQGEGVLDVTYAGDGSTRFGVQFNEMGMPIFYSQYNGSSSDWGSIAPFLTVASFIPGVAPFAQAAMALGSAYNGNYVGAALSALGAANSFGAQYSTINPGAANAVNGMDAASDAAISATSTFTTAANWLAQNASNITTAQQAVGLLNALDKNNVAGVIGALANIAPQVGITIPSDIIKPINIAATAAAISKGDWAAALDSASLLATNPAMRQDARIASKAVSMVDALKSGNPAAVMASFVDLAKTQNLGAGTVQSAAKGLGLPPVNLNVANSLLRSDDPAREVGQFMSYANEANRIALEQSGEPMPDSFFWEYSDSLTNMPKLADKLFFTPQEKIDIGKLTFGDDFDIGDFEKYVNPLNIQTETGFESWLDANKDFAKSILEKYQGLPEDVKEAVSNFQTGAPQMFDLASDLAKSLENKYSKTQIDALLKEYGDWTNLLDVASGGGYFTNTNDAMKYTDNLLSKIEYRNASNLWKDTLGYTPSDFELMEIIGLDEGDAKNILENKATTTYEEAESFLKDLYGSRHTPTEDEIISLMGLKEADAQRQATQQYNTWVEDKNSVTNDELTEFLAKAGLKEEDLTESQILSAMKTTEAGAETYLQRLSDLKETTFDGSEYKSQAEAQNAAIKNGYNTYIWEGKSYSLMSPEQAKKLEADRASGKNVGVTPDIITPIPGKTLQQQLDEAGNPDEYAYMQGDHVVVVSKRLAVPDYEDSEAWAAFKAEKEVLGGDNFQSYLTEKFSILEQAMKGAPEDSFAKMMASAAMWGYGKIANLAQTLMSTAEAAGMDPNTAGKRVASQVESWSKKLVDQGVQNAEAAVFANIAAVTKESIAQAKGVSPSQISDVELYYEKSKALLGQVKENPLGVGFFVSGEAIQEVPFLAVSGGVGRVFATVAGKTVGMSAALGTDVALNGAESFGGNYAEVRDYLIKQGVPEAKAHAAAVTSGIEAMGVSMITSYIGDRQLVKAFMGDMAQDSFGKLLISNATKEWLLGNVEGYLQNASAQIGKYGEFRSKDEAMNAGIMEGLAQKGIAAGVITADSLSRVVAKDSDGNNVTYKDIIDGTKTFDPSTLDRNFSFGSGLNLGDAIGYHSTFITNPDITPDEYFATAQAFRDNGLTDFSSSDIASIVGSEGETSLQDISSSAYSYADPRVVTPEEARNALLDLGYVDPTQEELSSLSGQRNQEEALRQIAEQYDPLATTVEEARQMMRDLGYENIADDEAVALAGKIKEDQARSNIESYVGERTVTRAEAEQFFRDFGYTPTEEELAQYIRQGRDIRQADVQSELGAYVDPRVVDEAEARAAYEVLGLKKPTQEDVLKMIGQYSEADLAGKAQANLDAARYNSIMAQLDELSVGATPEVMDAIEKVKSDLNNKITDLGGNVEELIQGVTTQIGNIQADTQAKYNALTTEQKALADALLQQGVDLSSAIQQAQQQTQEQIGQVSADVQAKYDALTAEQKALADQLRQQGVDFNTAIQAAQQQTQEQIGQVSADVQAKYDALTAEQKALADALRQQGVDLNTAINTATAQISADVQAKYDSLSTEQKALADALRQQGVDLNTAIETVRAQTQEQIGGLSADLQAKYNSLTAEQKALAEQLRQQGVDTAAAIEQASTAISADVQAKYNQLNADQKALADQLAQQGVDLRAAIDIASQQTQQQVMDLGASLNQRVDQLMQQGMDQYAATQQAIAEVNQQNQQLQGLVGTQGRTATQSDVDALTQMLSGQRSPDLTYDVNRDNQITQDDLAFLQSVVAGTSTGWKPPVGTVWGGTGLYGQIAANEAQRLADLQAAELKRQQDIAAQEALQRGLARQAQIRATAGQGQAQVQQLMTQIPQAVKAMESTTTPIYGQRIEDFDLSSPLDVGFFSPSKEKQGSQTGQQATKIATGGYLDDLLDLLR